MLTNTRGDSYRTKVVFSSIERRPNSLRNLKLDNTASWNPNLARSGLGSLFSMMAPVVTRRRLPAIPGLLRRHILQDRRRAKAPSGVVDETGLCSPCQKSTISPGTGGPSQLARVLIAAWRRTGHTLEATRAWRRMAYGHGL